MEARKIILMMLVLAAGVLLAGCSCGSWVSFWGGDIEEECASHWEFRKKTAQPADSPCPAPSSIVQVQTLPLQLMGDAVQLEKHVPSEVRADAPFSYHIKVTNTTDSGVSNVVVKDCVPKNLEIKSSVPKISNMEQGDVLWSLGDIGPKQTRIINIDAVARGTGYISTCAEVKYDMPLCSKINIVEPKLTLTKTAPSDALLCEQIPITYLVKNTGTGTACGIEITDELQKGLVTSDGMKKVKLTVDSLAPGQSREFKVMVDATKTGAYTSRAVAKSSDGDISESESIFTKVNKPELEISYTGPERQYLGRSMTYKITVKNKGTSVAGKSVLDARVPEGVKFISASEGGRYEHLSPGTVTWELGELRQGQSRSVQMTLTSDKAGLLHSISTFKAYCADTVSASVKTNLVGIPAILLEVVDISDPIEVGQTEEYIIKVTNQGSAQGTNISISCVLENNMSYISSRGPTQAKFDAGVIAFNRLPSLAPKDQAQWRVKVKALEAGDVRFKVMMKSDQLEREVHETEATNFYK